MLRKAQSIVFIASAFLVVIATAGLPRPSERIELVVIAVLIMVFGVPHGAFDTIFARQLHSLRTFSGWAIAGLLYSALGAIVVAIWLIAPGLFLGVFLGISAWHFSGDPVRGTSTIARILYGGAVIVLPALLHPDDVQRLFGFLAGSSAAASLTIALRYAGLPWLLLLIAAALFEARRDCLTSLEMIALAALSALAPPLIGFTLFFCAMHGARHILRTVAFADASWSPSSLAIFALAPMLVVVIASAVCWQYLGNTPFDMRIVRILFVGLAALTVPHMVLVERARFRKLI